MDIDIEIVHGGYIVTVQKEPPNKTRTAGGIEILHQPEMQFEGNVVINKPLEERHVFVKPLGVAKFVRSLLESEKSDVQNP